MGNLNLQPAASSTPKKQVFKRTCCKKETPLKVLKINFQSIKNKQQEILISTKPDIIIGTETWLNKDILSSEFFTMMDYTVYRKDRPPSTNNLSYGSVLVAITTNLLSEEIRDLQTDSESIWVQINMTNARKLIVGSYYRPQSYNSTSIEQLKTSLDRINQNAKSTIILGGDFNLDI
ncbi:unnamed protein product [Mytilus coruscus]|uniref:Endonuclease/exonuclease/phosphatase domain-containing protein n=1 Tax=Mytilus coruscus TaxID=42192 RepID=A0A6J8D7E8_MYTCO|nr:unnamed protein product [Mytilus coruscus]